jgi:membrane protease YdiL (CAAX protease family)
LKSFPLRGQNITVFILYQFTYIFYYLGWEFFFRGFALFGLRDEIGVFRALLFQALISTALHAAKPMPELLAALPGGILFGLVALRCRSLTAAIIAHWLLGFSLDLFILLSPA